jgi:glycine/D-amino acid oxidase-like deaminating enzyme
MQVAVIGADIAGIASVWHPRDAGHAVAVVERQDGPCLKASVADGGLVVPNPPALWNAPGVLRKPLRYQGDEDTPFIGGTPVKGVFVNAGHGPLGWTLACGGGKLVADPISAGPTDLCPSPFALARPS